MSLSSLLPIEEHQGEIQRKKVITDVKCTTSSVFHSSWKSWRCFSDRGSRRRRADDIDPGYGFFISSGVIFMIKTEMCN